jgi:uncharacterized membrane protein YhhN
MFAVVSIFLSFIAICFYMGFNIGEHSHLILKMLTASVFLAVGAIAFFRSERLKVLFLVFLGLVCGFLGDFFLATQHDSFFKWNFGFAVGLGFFFLEFVLLILAFSMQKPLGVKELVTAAVLCLPLIFVLIKARQSFGALLIPAIIYTFTVLVASVSSATIGYSGQNETARILLVLGIWLFAFSDLILGLNISGKLPAIGVISSQWANYCNAFSYFLGQTMIACSIYYYKN